MAHLLPVPATSIQSGSKPSKPKADDTNTNAKDGHGKTPITWNKKNQGSLTSSSDGNCTVLTNQNAQTKSALRLEDRTRIKDELNLEAERQPETHQESERNQDIDSKTPREPNHD